MTDKNKRINKAQKCMYDYILKTTTKNYHRKCIGEHIENLNNKFYNMSPIIKTAQFKTVRNANFKSPAVYDHINNLFSPESAAEKLLHRFNLFLNDIIKTGYNEKIDVIKTTKEINLPDPADFINKFIWKWYYSPCENYIKYMFNNINITDKSAKLLYIFIYGYPIKYSEMIKLHLKNSEYQLNFLKINYPDVFSVPLDFNNYNFTDLLYIYNQFLDVLNNKNELDLNMHNITINNLNFDSINYICSKLSFYHNNYTLKYIPYYKTVTNNNFKYKLSDEYLTLVEFNKKYDELNKNKKYVDSKNEI